MKKLALVLAALGLGTVAASATDMPLPAPRYTKAPVVVAPVATWTSSGVFCVRSDDDLTGDVAFGAVARHWQRLRSGDDFPNRDERPHNPAERPTISACVAFQRHVA
jgi:hypothetical protein